jgi:hypothetical protein
MRKHDDERCAGPCGERGIGTVCCQLKAGHYGTHFAKMPDGGTIEWGPLRPEDFEMRRGDRER